MTMVTFMEDGTPRQGYLVLPEVGNGKGILILHAWWGLNDFFKMTCDRLAREGFVTFAPDLNYGKIVTTVDEANQLDETRDIPGTQTTAEAALRYLQAHPAVQEDRLSAVGFSLGAFLALLMDESNPEAFDKIVLFYGRSGADLSQSKSKFQCHYGEIDEWEPTENVRQMKATDAEIYTYPDAYHWFFESDRPDHYDAEAAALAWKRTVEFLQSN